MGKMSSSRSSSTSNGGGPCEFALQVVKGRWFTVFASFLIMAGAGATYLFGVYSKDIKSTLGYDQTTLNMLGFFKDLGANVGVLSGLIGEAAYAGTATVVCLFMFIPLGVAIREELVLWNLKKKTVDPPTEIAVEKPSEIQEAKDDLDPESSSSAVQDQNKKSTSCCGDICKKPTRGEDYTILQALLSTDMIILFIATFCGLGSSLTAIDNLGQIGEALGYPTKTISTFVSLVSIWNYFGRVFSGFVSETLMGKWKVPRTLMMTIMLVLSSISYLSIAFPFRGSVYVASVVIGVSFGAQLTLLFTIISELFGLKYYATLFNCGQLASPLGSYILNVKVTGMLYDREALKQLAKKGLTRASVKELTCLGSQCYRLSFSILAGITFFGALVSLILVVRTREFYKGDIYKKYREPA